MRRSSGRTLILMYHRVAEAGARANAFCVHPSRLADQMERVRKVADVVPLESALEPSEDKRVAVTFDDGYADVVSHAKPILEALGIPATVFVIVGSVDKPGELWWHRLEHLILDGDPRLDHLEVDVAGKTLWIDVHTRAGRERAYHALRLRLREAPVAVMQAVLADLETRVPSGSTCNGGHRIVTRDELLGLVSGGLIDVGSHTVSHPFLRSLSPEEQRFEIVESRSLLERMIDREITAFAYPYGGRHSFDETTVGLVRQAGYRLACTTSAEPVTSRVHPLMLPRFDVGDWDGEQFAACVSTWLED